MKALVNPFRALLLFFGAFALLSACGRTRLTNEAQSDDELSREIIEIRAAAKSGADDEELLGQRLRQLFNKQQASKPVEDLVPKAKCVYNGDQEVLQSCYDQAVTRLLSIKPMENGIAKFQLTTGKISPKGGFNYKVEAKNIPADGSPAAVTSELDIKPSDPTNFNGNSINVKASGPKFMFGALGSMRGTTDGKTMAGGGLAIAFGYLDVETRTLYYGAAGCAGGAIDKEEVSKKDAGCGVVPVKAVPLVP